MVRSGWLNAEQAFRLNRWGKGVASPVHTL